MDDFDLDKAIQSQIDPNRLMRYHAYTFRDRRTEKGSGRTYHLHLSQDDNDADICAKRRFDSWIEYATFVLGHEFDDDVLFPAFPVSRKYSNMYVAQFKWTHMMPEGSVIEILNEVVTAMLSDGVFKASKHGPALKLFKDMYFTTHTFRCGFAQWKFFHEDKDNRWSLKMIMWWGGWSELDKTGVIMKYLLDSVNVSFGYEQCFV
ncbi:unnamed protein product [Aphanomyces euteiches]